jgi:arylsulfatase A-like enzyme
MDVHDHMLTGVPYAKTVERLDFGIGKLIRLLRAEGLLEDAVVILLADHGETLDERHWAKTSPGHRGNPSYAEQIDVPFIVSPARHAPAQMPLRSQDVFHWLADLAGATLPESDPVLRTDEIFLSELNWQTYQSGRFKSHRRRGSERVHVIDLVADPGERIDVADRHPEVVADHAARMDALSARLGAPGAGGRVLSPEDEEALRRLGYLE